MIENKKSRTKIVSFERDADYYFLKYQRQMDRGAYLDALESLRTAVKKQPENSEYKLALAEFYTEINYFEESNYWVLDAIGSSSGEGERCLFLLGCNFFGMREEQRARECFEKYLNQYPNGLYVPDVRDFLEMMDYDAEEYGVPEEYLERSDEGRDYLDSGQYGKAIEILGQICRKYPDLDYAKNNLALAYYCQGDAKKAIALSKEVLEKSPKDAHATCNLVLFHLSMDDPDALFYYCGKLETLNPEDVDEKIKIALTYCELNENEKAYRVLRDALLDLPYDPQALFLAGAAAANTGKLNESLEYFLQMMKLHPEDTVALYYKNIVQEAIDRGEEVVIPYNYQVPLSEMHRRISYLNSCFRKPAQQLEQLWQGDDYFSSMLLWGMNAGSTTIKRAIFDIICKFEDPKSQEFFKRFLLSRTEPDDLKNQALLCLRRMEVPQPYIAYLSGKIAEVRVGVMNEVGEGFTKSHQKVLEKLVSLAAEHGWKPYTPRAIELLGKYVSSFSKAPAMRNVKAWAAAFLCLSALRDDQAARDLSMEMQSGAGVEKSSLLRCMRAIERKLEETDSCSSR